MCSGVRIVAIAAWLSVALDTVPVAAQVQNIPDQDIWTTSVYSYAPGGGGPGGGLADGYLKVGGWGDLYYSLMQFDLTGLPKHAPKAKLQLYTLSAGGGTPTTLYLYQITQYWNWQTQGTGSDRLRLWWADQPSAVLHNSTPLPAPTVGAYYYIDITDLYNAWQSGTTTNYGIELRPSSNNNNFDFFASSRYPTPEWQPTIVFSLTCEYQIDCDFIQKHEGLLWTAYIPTNAGVPREASGVTISMGVDLGSGIISRKELEEVFNNNTNDPTYIALSHVLDKRAVQAEQALARLKNPMVPACVENSPYDSRCVFSTLTISLDQAQMLFDDAEGKKLDFLVPAWANFTKAHYPASAYKTFNALPPEAQTVLFDLTYAGLLYTRDPSAQTKKKNPSLATFIMQSKRFWYDMIGNLWSDAVSDLNVLATMDPDHRTRIADDAALLQTMATRLQ